MTNFLLVGNAAREHAIAKAIAKSSNVKIFCYANSLNPGIRDICLKTGGEYTIGNIENAQAIAQWAKERNIDLAFPSPDATLAAGVSDELEKVSILVPAPTLAASRIEWDKNFLRQLMAEYSISGLPRFKHFKDEKGLDEFIDLLDGNVAIKPCGLTGGKGVKVVGFQLKDAAEAKAYAREVLAQKIGGDLGVIVEEKLEGEEFSLMAFTDSKTLIPMPAVQDHKRAYENDLGPNTGGMGSYSANSKLLPFLEKKDYLQAVSILKKILLALKQKSIIYKGVIYGGFIATKNGVYCLETNARFGDPEALNVLAVLKTPLLDILSSIANSNLAKIKAKWERKATVVKYLVPLGYPEKSIPASPIKINFDRLKDLGVEIFYGSVDEKDQVLYCSKSRSIAILAKDNSIPKASAKASAAAEAIEGPLWYRKDIGSDELINKRIEHMKKLRSK